MLLCPDPFADQFVPHCVCRGLVEVQFGSDVAVLDQRVVEMAVEARLDRVDVLQLGQTPHGDLFLAIAGTLWRGHCFSLGSWLTRHTVHVHRSSKILYTGTCRNRCPC